MNSHGEQASYNAIGVPSTPVALTAAYTGNTKTMHSRYLPNIQINFSYTPKAGQTDRLAYILVEVSNDNGVTFRPYALVSATSDSVNVYVEGEVSTAGIPFVIPGDRTSTGGAAHTGIINLTAIGDFVKVSAREDGSADFGTLHLGVTLQN